MGKRDTEAPTNTNTLDNATKDFTPLSEEKLDFVTIALQHHGSYGTLMTAEVADERYGIDSKLYKKFMSDKNVQTALEQSGINIARFGLDGEQKWRSHALTPLQLVVANTMLNLQDTRSEKKKLQDNGVTAARWQSWLRDPVFSDYLRSQSELLLQNNQHEASLAIMDKVRAGDLGFTKLYLEYTGRFTSKADSGQNSNTDFQQLITSIIEIVIDEVDDPDTGSRIADRLKKLIVSRNTASALVGNEEPIAIPEVQEARQLSSHMEDLLSQGRGISDF